MTDDLMPKGVAIADYSAKNSGEISFRVSVLEHVEVLIDVCALSLSLFLSPHTHTVWRIAVPLEQRGQQCVHGGEGGNRSSGHFPCQMHQCGGPLALEFSSTGTLWGR